MSIYSDDQSQYSSVPPSAQPYRSLFGGSSQGAQSQDQASQLQDGKTLDQFDGAPTLGGPSAEYEESDDDLDYIQTSDRESITSPRKVDSVAPTSSNLQATSILKRRDSPESSVSSPPYRPNRFHGPAHLWLSLTREDREIAEALQETGARDLAAHLYNAHVLQSQGLVRLRRLNSDHLHESDPIVNGLDEDNFLNNLEEWTAWPMPSDEVPRADERLRRLEDDKWTFGMKPDARPSAGIEESIMAFLMKTAKERFQSRAWELPGFPDRKGVAQSDADEVRSGVEDTKIDTRGVDEEMDNVDWESEEEGLQYLRPVTQIDDDEGRRKLRPLTRHMITQLDQLLTGLHRLHGASESDNGRPNRSRSRGRKTTRNSSLASDKSSVYSRNTQTEDEVQHDTKSPLKQASPAKGRMRRTSERSYSRGRKRIRRVSQSSRRSSAHTEDADASVHDPRPTSAYRDSRSGLTDWRDVAGVASMIGLPPVVLQRATERFSALVNEDTNIPFVTGFQSQPLNKSTVKPNLENDDMEPDGAPRAAFVSRHAPVVERSLPPGERAVVSADRPSLSRNSSMQDDSVLVCPFKLCKRHTRGFSRRWNLNQHLKTMHPSYQPKDDKHQPGGVQSGYDTDMSE
ncbi:RNA polymerase I-specific transcription initiation factor-domain-containing protein [Aspergillus unguis]